MREMTSNSITRREFFQMAAGAAAAAAVLPSSSYARVLGANDRVRVGIIGFSDRSKNTLIPSMLQLAEELNFEIVALSDIWKRRREEGVAFLKEKGCKDVRLCRNNEELYGLKNIDAVIVGTCDFQHATHGVEAVKAGCHAYIEKPLANTMADAKAILNAVRESGKVVQIGTQRRSAKNYIGANEYIKSGKFGNIVMADMVWNVNQPGRWRRPALVEAVRKEDTDWKRFLVNRPYEEWDPRKYIEYRLFWPYSSGIPCQWMVHQIDTVHWFTGLKHPRSVVANGGLYLWQDGRKNFDTMTAVFDYGPAEDKTKGFQVLYSSRMTNSAGETKEVYFSNGGALDLDKGKVTSLGGLREKEAAEMKMKANLLPETSLVDEARKAETSANTGVDEMTLAHMRNWMECVRSGKKPNADIEAGYNHCVALCMTIAALQTGKRVTFDDKHQRVVTG